MTCSGEQKLTSAILKVDLQCCQCFRKIKKTLCRFPQIRDQVYDVKQNTVSITVVCCSPERILDKLCTKAGKSIKSVYIKPSPSKNIPDSDHHKPKPTPAADPQKPKPSADAPPVTDDKPAKKQSQTAPTPKADPPKAAANPPKADPPKAAANPPKADPPKVAADPPKADPPKAAGEPPKADLPKAAGEPPKADLPKTAGEPPKADPTKVAQAMQAAEPVAQWVPGYPPGPPPQVYPVSMYCAPSYDFPNYYPSYGRPPCPPPYYPARCDYFTHDNPSICSIM